MATKRKAASRVKPKAQKKPPKRKANVDLKPLKGTLRSVSAKLKRLAKNPPADITEEHVDTAHDIATAMQDAVAGLKDAIKRAAMADGQLAPGKTITAGGRLVYVKLRPGRKEGSTDPDDYDLVTEPIH